MKMKLWEYLYHLPKAIKAEILYGPHFVGRIRSERSKDEGVTAR